MASGSEARLRSWAAELRDGTVATVGEWLAPTYFTHAPAPDEPSASERIAGIASDLAAAMSDLSIELDGLAAAGDEYTATFRLTGTHDGVLWGAPPSGKAIAWENPVTIKPVGERFAVRFDDVAFPHAVGVLRDLGLVNPPEEMDQPPRNPVVPPDFLLKVVFTGQAADKPCAHLADIRVTEPATRMCAACVESGEQWPALRMCLTCGHVGCCDTSKNQHAKAHHEATGHALIRSIRMDEAWMWCYEDAAFFEGRTLDTYR